MFESSREVRDDVHARDANRRHVVGGQGAALTELAHTVRAPRRAGLRRCSLGPPEQAAASRTTARRSRAFTKAEVRRVDPIRVVRQLLCGGEFDRRAQVKS